MRWRVALDRPAASARPASATCAYCARGRSGPLLQDTPTAQVLQPRDSTSAPLTTHASVTPSVAFPSSSALNNDGPGSPNDAPIDGQSGFELSEESPVDVALQAALAVARPLLFSVRRRWGVGPRRSVGASVRGARVRASVEAMRCIAMSRARDAVRTSTSTGSIQPECIQDTRERSASSSRRCRR